MCVSYMWCGVQVNVEPLGTHSELLAPLHIQYVFNDNTFTHACNYMYMHIHMYTTDTLIHSCTDTHKSHAVTCTHTYTQGSVYT